MDSVLTHHPHCIKFWFELAKMGSKEVTRVSEVGLRNPLIVRLGDFHHGPVYSFGLRAAAAPSTHRKDSSALS